MEGVCYKFPGPATQQCTIRHRGQPRGMSLVLMLTCCGGIVWVDPFDLTFSGNQQKMLAGAGIMRYPFPVSTLVRKQPDLYRLSLFMFSAVADGVYPFTLNTVLLAGR